MKGQPMVAAVSPSAAYLSPAMGGPTPSPFSFSVASTRWSSSRPSVFIYSLVLRGMVLVFCFVSCLALAVTMSDNNKQKDKQVGQEFNNQRHDHKHGFQEYPEFVYSFVVTSLVLIYSTFQLSKGIYEIAGRGTFISDKTSDYLSFVLDKLAGYLLVSCSSVTLVAICQQPKQNTSLQKAAIASVFMSICALLTTAVSSILSGYKLSKRIMW